MGRDAGRALSLATPDNSLGASGCDVWTLARIAGHSSIAMSSRYVHPSAEKVLDALAFLGGHNIGHSGEAQPKNDMPPIRVSTVAAMA